MKMCGKSAHPGDGDMPGGQTLRIVSPCKPVVEIGSIEFVSGGHIGGLGATGTEQSVSQINDRCPGLVSGYRIRLIGIQPFFFIINE